MALSLAAFAGVIMPAPAGAAAPIAAHSMLQLNDPPSFMQTMFAQAAGMHASSIRLDVAPSLIFTDPMAAPDFTGLDEVMALSAHYKLPVLADLSTIPWWIANCTGPTDIADMTRCGTDDTAAYASMIGQIVAHAASVITDWEIWNEPDNVAFFTGTPAQYAGMLRAAHDAIKGVDPQAQIALGGISGVSGQAWVEQVFATPGDDAAHAFEIANVHERSWLDQIGADIISWRKFFAGYGFTGPLWVTEAGYPSDPAYQYDPSFTLGMQSQAAFLDASVPTMLSAGADEVFVTERDNLSGQYASEGVLGGDVADPPVAEPQVVEKPSYAAVSALAQCYASLDRDCPQAAPGATPTTASVGAARVGATSSATITVSDSGLEPDALGAAALSGPQPNPITLAQDNCSNRLLEPDQTCTLTVVFAPTAGGETNATLSLPSDNGTVAVPISAASPAVADLTSLTLLDPVFTPVNAADGIGHRQRLVLTLVNPLSAPVAVRRADLSGSRSFSLGADTCATAPIASGATCQLTVLFNPVVAGAAHTRLTLSGDGAPLAIALNATAFALPSLVRAAAGWCIAPGPSDGILVGASQQSTITWRAARVAPTTPGCTRVHSVAGSSDSASGHVPTARRQRHGAYDATVKLPLGRRGLRAGTYSITLTPDDAHGSGAARTLRVSVAG